ncbi:MAG: DUF1841 family protein [Rhodocyclaceae bacterium]
MFDPSRDQARQFFIETWRKHRAQEVLTPLEHITADLLLQHPEYHPLLEDPDSVSRDFTPEDGQINPFLHLSLHLAIEEQLSIDQPPGIRPAFATLQLRLGDRHEAMHQVLECLGETIWEAQQGGKPLDGAAYLERIRKRVR